MKFKTPVVSPMIQTIDENISHGIENGVLHLTTRNLQHDGKTSVFNDKEVLNFSSYSYLGLDQRPQFKQACMDAVQKYGTQFGFSRAFISVDLYDELEHYLGKVFDAEVVVAPSTTLAHQAVLPVMVGDKDAIIIDQQAHASMHYSVKSLRDRGVKVELVRHNRVDLIEEKIQNLSKKYHNVWYMCDSVYSMYGDYAPLKELEGLMNKYEQFHLYIDDAHGMSWKGKYGRGYALNEIDMHDQMILITSLNKAYAGAGGVIAVKDKEWKRRIRTCGGTLIFSTPIQPPMLGVDVESAKFHLTNELVGLQDKLKRRIEYCSTKMQELGLPDISESDSPIFYLPTSFPKVSYNLTKRMMDEGYYLTPTLFPAVSMRKAGLRFCINVNNTEDEIDGMVEALKYNYPIATEEEGVEQETIFKSFGINHQPLKKEDVIKEERQELLLERYSSIQSIDQEEWDNVLGNNGSFDWNGMVFLEKTFKNNDKKQDNWEFYYYIVRDVDGSCLLATFFTKCWCKDDMFKSEEISKEIEVIRKDDPYYLCTESLMMGSLMTEGEHMFLNRKSEYWEEGLMLMLNEVHDLQLETGVNAILLRDFESNDPDLTELFIANGFVKIEVPDFSHELNVKNWTTPEEFLETVNSKKRRQIRSSVLTFEEQYEVKVEEHASSEMLEHFYQLYLNVKKKSYFLNTFELPFEVFENMNEDSEWEMLSLSLKRNRINRNEETLPIAVVFAKRTEKSYIPLFVGLDYKYLYSHKNYKQTVYQVVKRAKALNLEKIFFGMTATVEKKRVGCTATKKNAFVQVQDTYNMEVLALARVKEMAF